MGIGILFILATAITIIINSRLAVIASSIDGNASYTEVLPHNTVKRNSTPPLIQCGDPNEGVIKADTTSQYLIWICKSGKWVSYQVEASDSLGKVESLTADSCKHIREALATDYSNLPNSGIYWVWKEKPMQVYCDMSTDGGGWTLVWKHSYLEISNLSTSMYYFSDYYKSCTTHDSGWCNIPDKKRFNATEQMIVAYHKGTIVYAYKGIFNYNIDHDWTGGVLVDFKKIIDTCTRYGSPNVQPAPSTQINDRKLLGLAFDKVSPYNYLVNCDTIQGTFDFPRDCRWHDCSYPTRYNTQQTVAIYVR